MSQVAEFLKGFALKGDDTGLLEEAASEIDRLTGGEWPSVRYSNLMEAELADLGVDVQSIPHLCSRTVIYALLLKARRELKELREENTLLRGVNG